MGKSSAKKRKPELPPKPNVSACPLVEGVSRSDAIIRNGTRWVNNPKAVLKSKNTPLGDFQSCSTAFLLLFLACCLFSFQVLCHSSKRSVTEESHARPHRIRT